MAKTPAAVRDLLETVWARARRRALADRDALQALVAGRRRQLHARAVGLALLRRKAAPAALRFRRGGDQAVPEPRSDDRSRVLHGAAPVRPELRAAHRRAGLASRRAGVGGPRRATARRSACSSATTSPAPSKRSGAWMTSLRDQEKLAGDIHPLIINVCNFAKAADGEPTLLSFDDARTLFHEFGHALHGLLSVGHLSENFRHQRRHRFRRAAVAALRALAGTAGGAAPLRAATIRPASRCRKICCSGSSPRAISTRALPRSNMSPRPSSISISIRCRRPARSMPPPSRPRRWRASACRTRSSCAIGRRTSPCLFRRRLCGGLLQLHVVGSARRRCIRGVRGDRRHFRSRHGETAA